MTRFGEVIEALEAGWQACREHWQESGTWIGLQKTEIESKWVSKDMKLMQGNPMTQPYLYIRTSAGHFIPYNPTHEDLLARDWIINREKRML